MVKGGQSPIEHEQVPGTGTVHFTAKYIADKPGAPINALEVYH